MPFPRVPEVIVEFLASKNQPILRFSADGSALVVVPGDGQTVKIFQVRPLPRTSAYALWVERWSNLKKDNILLRWQYVPLDFKDPDANFSIGERPLAYV
jgi:hypothetical protein